MVHRTCHSSNWRRVMSHYSNNLCHRDLASAPNTQTGAVVQMVQHRTLAASLQRFTSRFEVGTGNATPSMPRGLFDIVYADPPWQFRMRRMAKSIERHYTTLSVEDLKALRIPTKTDALLYLWTPPAILQEALEVMTAWGFDYRTNAVWDKELMGTGYWWRNQHELLLLGRKGSFATPPVPFRLRSVFRERRTVHSKKPELVYDMIERMYPGRRYLELFARNRRRGWTSWGNEV